ncbi:antibiotic biosynthesis monooxygenase family protein [Mucilaginibacter segetis]|uniref:Antibiotic biosynthesis monooxygenase n=1 Tax=Mucilaginibacter segetis TaxID=2793071 RepID=A0A934UL13_9SPHI|nr:antibiotic biosynthesis monooxygenase [Mucilaginibacter segetis]MBK0377874.1 antibiotic biosynthesis monooxygenase [Mucilaginibacter segetis]
MVAKTPEPPYYVVIFTSVRTGVDDGYNDMAAEMMQLAAQQEGFLGVESARNELGITISYWENAEAIKNWKTNSQHLVAQKYGRETWYASYKVRIAKVERDYAY